MKTTEPENTRQIKFNFFNDIRDILRNWWLLLATGLLLISVGIWIIDSPFQSYLTLSWVFAIGIVGTGILDILFALTNLESKRWRWWLLAGVFDLFAGAYLFNNSLITIVLLPLVIGLWTCYKGCMAIGDALHVRAYSFGNWRRLLFTGLVVVFMAALLLACPIIGIENIFLFSGLSIIAAGVFRVYWAMQLRRLASMMKNQARNR
ncbi:HdeD family acid-resistance protein [Mucilaginibacter aquariorum]|uniref:DUF308 domain-containing protein n=1 Tax=Mucilaginibacter aquariorum TaxID=2967225 RepID=A0ABT1T3M4_9SPHI|nr:DUF308 domain-containing protein [Mucilaginibacter aquariorum]MCQ6959204.1 DUF308 domain-containing protein [Mucilaginibacter aquariorum]